jgi:hypothetical protein
MLDTEASDRRRGPGRHRRPVTQQRGTTVMTLLRAMNAWFAGKVKRER